MFKGFREFIARGNVTDLAIAVVIGAAFNAVVTAVVENVLNPLIGLFFNANSLNDALTVTIASSSGGEPAVIKFGVVVAALIQFLIVAAFIYVAVVLPINRLKRASFANRGEEPEAEVAPTELELLGQIRDLLENAQNSSGGKHSADAS